MANYSVLKAAVQAVVKTNGNQEIMGANMQSTLISIINLLGTGYQFMGVATPNTSPGTPDYNVAYLGGAGTYANFGTTVTVPVGSIGVFRYDGSWTSNMISIVGGIDIEPVENSPNLVTSGGVYAQERQTARIFYHPASQDSSIIRNDVYSFKPNTLYRLELNIETFPTIPSGDPWMVGLISYVGSTSSTFFFINSQWNGLPTRVYYFITPSTFDKIRVGLRGVIDYSVKIEEVTASDNVISFRYHYSANVINAYPYRYPVDKAGKYILRIKASITGEGEIPTSTGEALALGYSTSDGDGAILLTLNNLGVRDNVVELDIPSTAVAISMRPVYTKDMDCCIKIEPNFIKEENPYYEKNLLPVLSHLDANTQLFSQPSENYWGAFHNAVASKVEDYIHVDIPSSVLAWPSIRINKTLISGDGTQKVRFRFRYRTSGGNDTSYLYLFIDDSGSPVKLFSPTEDWTAVDFTLVLSGLQNRLQIANRNATGYTVFDSFDIKDFCASYVEEGSYEEEITNIKDAIESISEEIAYPYKNKLISILGDSISTANDNNAVQFTVLESDVQNNRTLQGYPTYYDIGTTIGNVTVTSDIIGVLTSFTPTTDDVGKTIGKPLNYNSLTSDKIWWGRMIEALKAQLLQNVSWSGASVSSHEGNNEIYKTSYAWHDAQIAKLAKRDANGNAITPDVVVIYRGTNDLSHSPYARLDDYGAESTAIPSTDVIGDNVYGFKEAYALTIQKIRNTYPSAYIVCCTLNVFKRVIYDHFPTRNGYSTLPEYNNAIREVANQMGCGLIEFDKDGITFENCYPTFISDSATTPTHPNATGHARMAKRAITDITNNSIY